MSELEPSTDHVDVERLLALAHGEIGEAEAEQIRRHARDCRECGDELAVLLALRIESADELDETRQVAHDAVGGPWLRRRRALIAASVVFVAVLGALMTSGVLDPASPDAAGLATSTPPDSVDLDFLFGNQQAQGLALAREATRSGFALMVDGRLDEAVELLSGLNEMDPADDEAATGLGIALYLRGGSDDRAEWLLVQGADTTRQDFSHYAKWYLGNLYLRRGELARAVRVLDDISTEPDFPGTWARDLVRRLQTESR